MHSSRDSGALTGVTLGRYIIGALLGRGGMGEVYEAADRELGRAIALKVLPAAVVGDEDRLSRFVQEARAASALNHPHLVAIYEIGQGVASNGVHVVHYIAMELVRGETLRTTLAGESRDIRKTLDYLTQAAEALAAAHGAGIVHRDFKPDNVMIASGGYAKVLDFGLAKLRGEAALQEGGETVTVAGTSPGLVMGTVGYMSPEQAEGRPADHRSDIFSFGCVLYEALTGVRAFDGTSTVDTLHQIIHADPAPINVRLPGAPADLQRIVRKCLAKNPDDRYQSLREVVIDLRDVRRQMDSGPAPAVQPPRDSRHSMAMVAGVAVLILVVAAALLLWRARAPAAVAPAALKIDRLTNSGNVTDAVLSPDGKYLAYVESLGGVQGLWLRQVQGSRPIQLVPAAPIGFWGLTFARDGQSIYYAAKLREAPLGALYQVPVLGGTPRQLLAEIDSGVTLSPDSSRLAYYRVEPGQNGSSSLMIANADGSGIRALATVRPPEFLVPAFYAAPSWSPDGTRISAFIRNTSIRQARLTTFDVARGAAHDFDERYAEGTATAWLPDGSGILYTAVTPTSFSTGNGGQIYLQPYPSGTPRRVTSDLQDYRNIAFASDGRSFVSVGFDADSRVSVMPIGGGEQRVANDRYDGVRGVAWLPDASGLFYTHIASGARQIWRMARDGSNKQDVIVDGSVESPAVSHDGRLLAFAGTRGDQRGVWRSDLDGTSPVLLTPVSGAQYLTFAPDDRGIFFTAQLDGQAATYRVDVNGGTPVRLPATVWRAAVAPDGTVAGVYRHDERSGLALGILSPAGVLRQSFDVTFATSSGSVQWEPDGAALLYTTAERSNIWRQPVAGGPPQKITNFADGTIVRFALSPDGKSIAISRGAVTRDALLMTDFR